MRFLCVLPLLLLSAALQAEPRESDLPRRMAALGDSMTEGLFARYSFESGISAGEVWEMIATLGLSAPSQRMLNFRRKFADRGLSWSTGFQKDEFVMSHAERLQRHQKHLFAMNFAESGAESWDLKYQVKHLLAEQEASGLGFDYVTLLMGANDLLATRIDLVTTTEDFITNIESALFQILDANPSAKILLVGVPEFFEILHQTRDEIVTRIWGYKITCDDLRTTILGEKIAFDANHPEYEALIERFQDYQNALLELGLYLEVYFPDARIKVLRNFRTAQRYQETISVDCFHPSYKGQGEIAESTWREGFWPEL